MFGQVNTSNDTIRKYVIYFGSLFNDIYLTRDDEDGSRAQTFKVPLNYGPRDKFLARLEGDKTLDRNIAIQLPRMSFEIINYSYAADRKLNGLNRISTLNSDSNTKTFQYAPVPYDIDFALNIMVKNALDGTRIIEQILPYFQPDFTATLNLNGDIPGKYDIPLILNSVTQSDTYEGVFEQRRALIWTLTFTLKGWFFAPSRTSNVIKQVEVNYIIPNGNVDDAVPGQIDPIVEMKITPGLTANGEPTSNSSLTIDKNLIQSTDNYGYIIDFEENYDV